MDPKNNTWLWVAVIVGLLLVRSNGCKLPLPGPSPSQVVTHVTYVYEKDSGGVPGFVGAALNALNHRTPPILATPFEDDTKNGLNQVPAQYRAASEAARAAGTPCLVIQAGSTVLKTVKDPKQEDFDAIK